LFTILKVSRAIVLIRLHIQNSDLTCEKTVKLLGIEIDYQLNFDAHVSSICRKASQQLNVLKRLGSQHLHTLKNI
jgi:hypothetical protein